MVAAIGTGRDHTVGNQPNVAPTSENKITIRMSPVELAQEAAAQIFSIPDNERNQTLNTRSPKPETLD